MTSQIVLAAISLWGGKMDDNQYQNSMLLRPIELAPTFSRVGLLGALNKIDIYVFHDVIGAFPYLICVCVSQTQIKKKG